MTLLQLLVLAGLTMFSCSKEDSTGTTDIQIPVVDTLKGNWNWYATLHPKKGLIENEYKYVIRFVDLNNDSTVSYETYKNDTLIVKSNLKISRDDWGRKIEPKIILQFTIENGQYFKFLSKDTLQIYERCNDCSIYYYSKN